MLNRNDYLFEDTNKMLGLGSEQDVGTEEQSYFATPALPCSVDNERETDELQAQLTTVLEANSETMLLKTDGFLGKELVKSSSNNTALTNQLEAPTSQIDLLLKGKDAKQVDTP